jgi:ATP-binding cassette subfamily F protein uup
VSIIYGEALSKSFGAKTILDDVTLTIEPGERVGLVGRNGSGKSTLARILAGREPTDHGTLARRKGARVLYLEQEPVLPEGERVLPFVLSGLEAWWAAHEALAEVTRRIEAGHRDDEHLARQSEAAAEVERLGGWQKQHEAERVLEMLGLVRHDARIGDLSGGERRRVALARLLFAAPELAILDEPSNHLDAESIEALERHLVESFRGAVLLVTHDRYLLDRVVMRTFELESGKLYAYEGGYERYLEAKAEREELAARTESNRRNFLRTELEWLRRQPKARGTKQKARIERAETALSNRPRAEGKALALSLDSARQGKTVLEIRGLSLAVPSSDAPGAPLRALASAFDLTLVPGDRVGIVGRSGAGKTTLLRTLLGEQAPASGSFVLGKQTRIAYLDQARSGLDPEHTIFEAATASGKNRVMVGGEAIEMRSFLERFLFDVPMQRQKVGGLSGGERARLLLARMLSDPANLLVLDEPTNDLDLPTLAALESLLVDTSASALIVSHDRYFLDRVATKVLSFEPARDGSGVAEVVLVGGGYASLARYRDERQEERSQAARAVPAPRGAAPAEPPDAKKAAAKKGLSFAEKRELEGILARIEEAEGRVAERERELSDPAAYKGDVSGHVRALEEARREVEALVARWEELEAKRA